MGLYVSVRQRPDAVVLTARGEVEDPSALCRLLGAGMTAAGRRPALVDVSELQVAGRAGPEALCRLLAERPAGAATVVLAPTALRRRLDGLFGPEVAWYPSGARRPWAGVVTSLWHRRRHLPPDQRRHPVEDPLGELVWAAARLSAPGRPAAEETAR